MANDFHTARKKHQIAPKGCGFPRIYPAKTECLDICGDNSLIIPSAILASLIFKAYGDIPQWLYEYGNVEEVANFSTGITRILSKTLQGGVGYQLPIPTPQENRN